MNTHTAEPEATGEAAPIAVLGTRGEGAVEALASIAKRMARAHGEASAEGEGHEIFVNKPAQAKTLLLDALRSFRGWDHADLAAIQWLRLRARSVEFTNLDALEASETLLAELQILLRDTDWEGE